MKRYMKLAEYSEASGLPMDLLRRLCRSWLADQFTFRASGASNAPIYIIVPVFEKMLDRGDLKEVLEG